jgi:hypothetical protein
MNLEEFQMLMSSLIEGDFPVRDLPIFFNLSMKLQVDEISSDRHYNMQFPEFVEAFCRVIDKSSPCPPGEDPVNILYFNDLNVYLKYFYFILLNLRLCGLIV